MATDRRIDIAAVLAALPSFPRIQGKRMRLRGPTPDDADDLFALFSDPEVMRYWSSAPMQARAQAEGKIDEILAAFAQRGRQQAAEAAGKVIELGEVDHGGAPARWASPDDAAPSRDAVIRPAPWKGWGNPSSVPCGRSLKVAALTAGTPR